MDVQDRTADPTGILRAFVFASFVMGLVGEYSRTHTPQGINYAYLPSYCYCSTKFGSISFM